MSSSRGHQDKGKVKLVELPSREEDGNESDDVEFIGHVLPLDARHEDDDPELVSIEIPMRRKVGVEANDDVELVSVEVRMEGRTIEQGQSSYGVALEEARRVAPNHEPCEFLPPTRRLRGHPIPPIAPRSNAPNHPSDSSSNG